MSFIWGVAFGIVLGFMSPPEEITITKIECYKEMNNSMLYRVKCPEVKK